MSWSIIRADILLIARNYHATRKLSARITTTKTPNKVYLYYKYEQKILK